MKIVKKALLLLALGALYLLYGLLALVTWLVTYAGGCGMLIFFFGWLISVLQKNGKTAGAFGMMMLAAVLAILFLGLCLLGFTWLLECMKNLTFKGKFQRDSRPQKTRRRKLT